MKTISTIRSRIAALAVLILLATAGLPSIVRSAADHGEVTAAYVGRIVSHSEKTGEIVVRTARSTHHWKLGRRVAAYYGKDRVQLSVVWHRAGKVRLHVSHDGEVQRITVLSWR